ncbi:MAG: hypothetical protein K2I06_02695 [Ruminococcus sp.]|nr:hypothetical protein [Ruminococcus sp.]
MKKKKKIAFKYHLKKFATGTISLFLVILLTPFMTIASILIEAQHYNSSIALLDEAMGVSSVSLLADYDKWLKDRWGLIATNQHSDMEEGFLTYLEENTGVLGKTLTINDVTARGLYALDDNELFRNEILQYSKYNISTKAADDIVNELFNIFGITKALNKLKSVDNILKLITNGEKTADSMLELCDSQKKLQNSSNDVKNKIQDCQNQFKAWPGGFESGMNNLTKEMKNDKKTDDSIQNKKDDYTTARNKYIEKINNLISALETYKTDAKGLSSAMDNVKNNLTNTANSAVTVGIDKLEQKYEDAKKAQEDYNEERKNDDGSGDIGKSATQLQKEYNERLEKEAELEKNIQNAESELLEAKMANNMEKAAQNGYDSLEESYKSFNDKCSEAHIDEQIGKLKEIRDSIPTADEITEDDIADGYKVDGIEYATVEEIKEFIDNQNREKDAPGFIDFVEAVISTVNTLANCSGLCEPALCAMVSTDSEHNSPANDVIKNIGGVFNSALDFNEATSLKAYWTAVKNLCHYISETVKSINKFVGDMLVNIPSNVKNVFTTDRLWYMMYSYYMTTCRTDYDKLSYKTTKTEMGVSPTLPKTEVLNNIPGIGVAASFFETMGNLINVVEGNEQGLDTTFYGAEMEYLICGSQSEIANQACVFMMSYILRLIIDIPAIFLNKQVQGMADVATTATAWGGGFGGPIVWAFEILLEPFVDTFILVNGGEIDFYEETIYLTPSGILSLIQNVIPGLVISAESKKKMEDEGQAFVNYGKMQRMDPNQESKPAETKEDIPNEKKLELSMPKINYRQQCLILLLLFASNDQITDRLKDLIQMEGKYYYQQKNNSDFSLDKCFTFIETEADVKIKQIAPSLTDSSLFEVKRKIYRGY